MIVDRRATFDDARGMGEGILDSVDTVHKYWLLYESISQPVKDGVKEARLNIIKDQEQNEPVPKQLSLPTDHANLLSRRINYPTIQYMGKSTSREKGNINKENKDKEALLASQIKLLKSKVRETYYQLASIVNFLFKLFNNAPLEHMYKYITEFTEPSMQRSSFQPEDAIS